MPNLQTDLQVVTIITVLQSLYSDSSAEIWANALIGIAEIWPVTLALLFTVMCLLASRALRTIRNEIENLTHTIQSTELDVACKELKKWKRNHVLVIRFIRELNEMFGPILLIESCYIFVGIISVIYWGFQKDEFKPISFTYTTKYLVEFGLICFVPDQVTNEVIYK